MTRIAAFILIALVAVLAIVSVRFVGEGEVALVGRGEAARELASGIHLIKPFSSVKRYDLSPRYSLSGPGAVRVPLGRGKVATVEGTVEARLDRSKVKALDAEYQGQVLERLIIPLLARDLKPVLAREADPAAADLGSIGAGMAAALTRATGALGVEVTAVTLARVSVAGAVPPADLARRDGLKVFILGLDGYDWAVSDAVSKTIELPNIARLKREGAWGDLRSIEPLVSPMIWTTIATGATPDVHGISDFLATDPETGEEIPATSTNRRTPALWNMASLGGLKVGFVGWLATYPAEDVDGFIVSDRIAYHMFDPAWAAGKSGAGTAAEGLTYPEAIFDEIRPLLVEPSAVDRELRSYIRGPLPAARVKFDPTDPVTSLRLAISSYETYRGIIEKLYPEVRPDLAGVYFEFTDSISHLFMRDVMPLMPGVTEADVTKYGGAVTAAYAEADRIIGEVLAMLDDRTVLIVVSDHGFKSGDTRPMSDPRIGVGQAMLWHRLNGAVALWGPPVKRGYQIADAGVLDIAPTALHLLGLPVGDRMTGKVLAAALDPAWVTSHPARKTAAYDSLLTEGGAGFASSAADEALKDRLESLGYVAGGNASLVNMANFYQRNGRYAEAIEVWRKLIAADPKDAGAKIGLANAYFEIGKEDSAFAGLRAVIAADPRNMLALRSLATLYVRKGNGTEALRVAEQALAVDPRDAEAHFDRGLGLELLGRRDQAAEEYRRAVALAPDLAEPYANLAQYYLDKGMANDAVAAATKAAGLAPDKPEVQYVLGQTLEGAGRPDEALSHYLKSLSLDARFTAAAIGAASVLLSQGKADSALAVCDAALRVSDQYGGYLHTLKGSVFLQRREARQARTEFEAALRTDRSFLPARVGLARALIADGKTGEARRELEAVLAAQPSNQEARNLLNSLR